MKKGINDVNLRANFSTPRLHGGLRVEIARGLSDGLIAGLREWIAMESWAGRHLEEDCTLF